GRGGSHERTTRLWDLCMQWWDVKTANSWRRSKGTGRTTGSPASCPPAPYNNHTAFPMSLGLAELTPVSGMGTALLTSAFHHSFIRSPKWLTGTGEVKSERYR